MSEPTLPEKVTLLHEALNGARIAHAFGGALALAYYAEPRATIDIDVNIFLVPEDSDPVWNAFAPLGVATEVDRAVLERDGQCRTWWGRTPVDLFFSSDAIHEAMKRMVRTVPFAAGTIPILAPEHLMTCKLAFDRAKDWIDIEQMLVTVEHLDLVGLLEWADRIVGASDPRYERLTDLIDRIRGTEA